MNKINLTFSISGRVCFNYFNGFTKFEFIYFANSFEITKGHVINFRENSKFTIKK